MISFDDYMAGLPAEQQKRVNDKAKQMIQAIELAKLRKQTDLNQSQLAKRMGVSQANVSKVESGKDIQLSTLINYVSALGGELSIKAVMPNGETNLM